MSNIAFGPYAPDLANHGHEGLTVAKNVYPIGNGYAPVGDFASVTSALTGWNGGSAFIKTNGSSIILSGTASGLYDYTSLWTSQYAVAAVNRWRFSQHGTLVVCVHGGAPVAYSLSTGAGSALGGSPPNASFCATVGNFTFLAGNPLDVSTVTWSGFGNPESWTIGTNQCNSQTLPDGGKITGLAGGEFGLLFQNSAVYRYTYIGGETVWQRDKIGVEIGCINAATIAQAGRLTFFLSERGFMQCDGNAITPIGTERIDRTVFAAYARSSVTNVYAAADPRRQIVAWAFPGSPGMIYAYNWALDRWSTIEITNAGMISALSPFTPLDAIGGLVDATTELVDSATYAGGVPTLYVVNTSGVIGTLSGSNLAATITTPFNELIPGQRVRPYQLRPVTDATSGVTVTVDARMRLGDSANTTVASTMQTNGDMPLRCNGRYLTFQTVIAAATTWTHLQGLEVEFGSGGKR